MVVEVTTTVLDSRFRSIRMKIYILYIQDLNIGFSICDRKIFKKRKNLMYSFSISEYIPVEL